MNQELNVTLCDPFSIIGVTRVRARKRLYGGMGHKGHIVHMEGEGGNSFGPVFATTDAKVTFRVSFAGKDPWDTA